ncbi:WASH complex subunit FAM21 [Orchesella cincta]|uniref:WASH complex subunit FAM21 n=1 Tax=Orchesella cincta TaxID=48709 RepID=A0A1D2MAM0_ORCCI|nr:WASH complex subunit FAM21 [Orchesella cincta]
MTSSKKEEAVMESEEMLARSSSWTLACDNALLNRLKAFSEKLTENSQEISKECDKMSTDVTQLNYKLLNLTNEFLMLSNTQFVENRVEEFEEFSASLASTSGNATVSYKTKAETEAELISKMKEAIQTGLAACNERKVQNGSSVNRFKMKRPHLIGSPKFFSSKFCGLVDESRRIVPSDRISLCDSDTMSLGQASDNEFMRQDPKPVVTFTMPPQPVFPVQVPGTKSNLSSLLDDEGQNTASNNDYLLPRNVVPPSPSNSNRSSDFSTKSNSVSREIVPRSITDDLNKIYSSFAPPPSAGLLDDDSDDDFKPATSGGRLFDDDDDDLFGEKELFPSGQKNSDFFGTSNPSKIAAPLFSVPPPVQSHRLQTPQPTFASEQQTLVGPQPKTNDFPNRNLTGDFSSQNGALIRDAEKTVPETVGPSRAKLLPGAVSMFGGLPPPVFNDDGTLQAAESLKNTTAQLQSKENTQNSSASSYRSGTGLNDRDSNTRSSQPKQEDLHNHADVQSTSQPRSSLLSSGRSRTETESISRGSLSGSGDVNRISRKAPVSSLFVDDSSDEDIFSSSKKQTTLPQVIRNSASDNKPSAESSNHSTRNVLSATKKREEPKSIVKKSIFEDSESDDDIFSTKQPVITTNKSTVDRKTPKAQLAPTTSSGKIKKSALFSEESDSDTDLFGNKKPGKVSFSKRSAAMDSSNALSSVEDAVADDQPSENFDKDINESTNQIMCDDVDAAVVVSNLDNTSVVENLEKEKIIDELKVKKSVGSKISEKIKAMENSKSRKHDDLDTNNDNDSSAADKSKVPSKPIKSKISVKTLALSLNINPLAMKVGAKPPKPGQTSSNPGTPDQEENTLPKANENSTSSPSSPDVVSDSSDKISNQKESGNVTPTSRTSVKSLASSLNINPLAMKVGAKPPKPGQTASNPGTPDQETNKFPIINKEDSTESPSNSDTISDGLEKPTGEKDPDSAPLTPRDSVKSLASSLNINSLKVGAKSPRSEVSSSSPSTPDKDTNQDDTIPSTSNSEVISEVSEKTTDEKEPENVTSTRPDNTDQFFHIIKTRPKIQQKRRPPSRVFLKALALHDDTEKEEIVSPSNGSAVSANTSEDTIDNPFTPSSENVTSSDVVNTAEDIAETENSVETGSIAIVDDTNVEEQLFDTDTTRDKINEGLADPETSEGEEKSENQKLDLFEDEVKASNFEKRENAKTANSTSELKGTESLFETPLPNEGSDDEDLFTSKGERKSIPPTTQQAAEGSSKSSSQTSRVSNHNSKKSIFDDSDSDTDLFATKSSKLNNNNNDDSLFSTSKPKPKLESAKKVSSLFGDDSDSESDLFKSKPKPKQKKAAKDDITDDSATVKVYGGKSSFFDSSDEN